MGNKLIETAIARGAFSITPNDSADLAQVAFGVHVSGAGTLHYTGKDGVEHTVTLLAGARWDVAIVKVFATGTSATGISGFNLYD